MGKGIAALVAVLVASAIFAATASAFAGGGRKPSEAPPIVPGVHYSGELNNHKSDANYGGSREVALWRLPSVATHDLIVVSWHELPFAHSSSFPICMILAQNVNDYSWGGVFGGLTPEWEGCESDGPRYSVSGSGTAETGITIQEGSADSSYLEFYTFAREEDSTHFETYPYDFTVSGPLHYLSAAITPATHVRVNGVVHATVTLADGSPAPDGLVFSLTVNVNGEAAGSYAATTAGGGLGFTLALPETLIRDNAEFVVSRPADGTYQAVEGAKLEAQLAKPKAVEPSSACIAATSRAHALARQLHRLRRHAARARSWRLRRRLRRRARQVGHRLRAARAEAGALC